MSADVAFREAAAADRDAILALRAIAFPDDDREKRRSQFWEWEFRRGYAGPARVYVAENGDRIVGHFAFVPQRYHFAGNIEGALAVDVMGDPQFRRQKIFSRLSSFAAHDLRKHVRLVTALQIREEVMGGMEAGGWRAVNELPVLLKPVSLRRIAQDLLKVRSRLPAAEVRAFTATARFEDVDSLLATDAPRQPRTVDFLAWRYTQNPEWRYSIDGRYEAGRLRAFLIQRDTVLRGMRTMAIADAGGDVPAIGALVSQASATCHERGVGLAAALISKVHPAYHALRRCGFIRGPHRFNLLLQVFDPSLDSLMREPWSLSWGDTDHL